MAKPKFPPLVFVTNENEGTEEEYLSTHRDAEEALEAGEKKRVATYKLVEVRTGSLTPQFE